MRLIALALVVGVRALREFVTCPAQCATDLDCSLNGVCSASGTCTCDAGWVGLCCTTLDFLPAKVHGSYRHNATSTWGGNIISENGVYHMWIAEMAPKGTDVDPGAGSCGLTTWSSASQITHVTSTTLAGPYTRAEVALGTWSHNPLVRRMPGGGPYVLFHIGAGGGGGAPPPSGYCAMNGTSPCGEQSFDQCGGTGCAAAGAVPGYACYDGACSGDGGGGVTGDCGADLAEPALDCSDWTSCARAGAEACASTPTCASFALSPDWFNLRAAKLFSAGTGGLIPNSQWTAFVSTASEGGAGGEWDVRTRSRRRGQGVWPPTPSSATCALEMHVSNTTSGPWLPYPFATITPCGGNNPAPWVHPNGTVFLVVTDQDMGLYSAPTWGGPYTLVTTGACGGGEDPSLFLDSRGHWHCMFHRSPFSNPDAAIGHAYSLDGFTWYVASDPAANSSVVYDSGLGVVVHGKRERPHPYFDESGRLSAFVSGVCLVPSCDPLDGAPLDPTRDCTSGTQYAACDSNSPGPGWYDKTYTLVQEVNNGG